MKKNQIRKRVAALAMAAVVSVSLLGYGCGSKSASSTAGVSGHRPAHGPGKGRLHGRLVRQDLVPH